MPSIAHWRLDWLDVQTLIANTERIFTYPMADTGVCGLRSYEAERCGEKAAVVVANREMHAAGHTRSGAELDRIPRKYRTDTARSTRA
jgi:hypothetical protein